MIKYLTLTGADDTVDPESLLKLSEKYPFVEWGILLSKKRHGQPRYPSTDWLDRLAQIAYTDAYPGLKPKQNFSLHLCGEYVREFLKGSDAFAQNLGNDLFLLFNRVQINTHGEEHEWNVYAVSEMIRRFTGQQFIFQLDGNAYNESMAKLLVFEYLLPNVAFLQDGSSGAGVLPQYWMKPQASGYDFGYAGGLGPDNIEIQLSRITEAAKGFESNIWVDMETKLRTNKKTKGDNGPIAKDSFDLDKCQQVLEIATPVFHPEVFQAKTSKFKEKLAKAMGRIAEPDCLNIVAEFHKLFEHPILQSPDIPSIERCALRINLIKEEAEELHIGMMNKDIVEVADALADLQYVLSGAVLEFGLQNKFKALLEEVHRSNMSKACKDRGEALQTISKYKEATGEDHHYEERGGLYFVYRTRDMKTVKSINYSPADLFKVLHEEKASGNGPGPVSEGIQSPVSMTSTACMTPPNPNPPSCEDLPVQQVKVADAKVTAEYRDGNIYVNGQRINREHDLGFFFRVLGRMNYAQVEQTTNVCGNRYCDIREDKVYVINNADFEHMIDSPYYRIITLDKNDYVTKEVIYHVTPTARLSEQPRA